MTAPPSASRKGTGSLLLVLRPAQMVRDVGGWLPVRVMGPLVALLPAGATVEAIPDAIYRAHVRPNSRNRTSARRADRRPLGYPTKRTSGRRSILVMTDGRGRRPGPGTLLVAAEHVPYERLIIHDDTGSLDHRLMLTEDLPALRGAGHRRGTASRVRRCDPGSMAAPSAPRTRSSSTSKTTSC